MLFISKSIFIHIFVGLMLNAVYNIRSDYNCNTIKYTHEKGVSWRTITSTDRMYSYSDINDYIHQYRVKKIIIQLTQQEIKSFTSISLLFYQPIECQFLLMTVIIISLIWEEQILETLLDLKRKLLQWQSMDQNCQISQIQLMF